MSTTNKRRGRRQERSGNERLSWVTLIEQELHRRGKKSADRGAVVEVIKHLIERDTVGRWLNFGQSLKAFDEHAVYRRNSKGVPVEFLSATPDKSRVKLQKQRDSIMERLRKEYYAAKPQWEEYQARAQAQGMDLREEGVRLSMPGFLISGPES
jgi:hypothetical protein